MSKYYLIIYFTGLDTDEEPETKKGKKSSPLAMKGRALENQNKI